VAFFPAGFAVPRWAGWRERAVAPLAVLREVDTMAEILATASVLVREAG
jgi:hypothetical protein